MKIFKIILFIFLLSLQGFVSRAQSTVEMADGMRAEGKIYVVVAIILIVLVGLLFYIFMLDRKIKKLENLLSEKQRQTK